MRPHSEKETRDYLREKRYKRELENRKARENLETIKSETKDERAERKEREKKYNSFTKTKELPLFSDEDIEKVITRLKEREYLDDYKFAKYYIENRFTKKGISSKRLRMELMKKGISRDIIDQVLEESDRNDEDEIRKIITKKRAKYDDEKLIQYLCRQGFQFETVRNLVHEMDSQNLE
jgi:regulatory protein